MIVAEPVLSKNLGTATRLFAEAPFTVPLAVYTGAVAGWPVDAVPATDALAQHCAGRGDQGWQVWGRAGGSQGSPQRLQSGEGSFCCRGGG